MSKYSGDLSSFVGSIANVFGGWGAYKNANSSSGRQTAATQMLSGASAAGITLSSLLANTPLLKTISGLTSIQGSIVQLNADIGTLVGLYTQNPVPTQQDFQNAESTVYVDLVGIEANVASTGAAILAAAQGGADPFLDFAAGSKMRATTPEDRRGLASSHRDAADWHGHYREHRISGR